jgi:hypothetical protein
MNDMAKKTGLTIAVGYDNTGTGNGSPTLHELTCEEWSSNNGWRGGYCGRPATQVKVSRDKRQPICGIHAGALKRGWAFQHGYDILEEATADDVSAQYDRKVASDAAKAVERKAKAEAHEARYAAAVSEHAATYDREYAVTRKDREDFAYTREGIVTTFLPRWEVAPTVEGPRYLDSYTVEIAEEYGQRYVKTNGSGNMTLKATRALVSALNEAAAALNDPFRVEVTVREGATIA